MCEICDGVPLEEVERRLDLAYEVEGWVWHHIDDRENDRTWAYTVGLKENFGQPDVLMRGGGPSGQATVIPYVGMYLSTGGRHMIDNDPLLLMIPIDPEMLDDELVYDWIDRIGRRPTSADMLELFLMPETPGNLRC